jgi:hypothetical protein
MGPRAWSEVNASRASATRLTTPAASARTCPHRGLPARPANNAIRTRSALRMGIAIPRSVPLAPVRTARPATAVSPALQGSAKPMQTAWETSVILQLASPGARRASPARRQAMCVRTEAINWPDNPVGGRLSAARTMIALSGQAFAPAVVSVQPGPWREALATMPMVNPASGRTSAWAACASRLRPLRPPARNSLRETAASASGSVRSFSALGTLPLSTPGPAPAPIGRGPRPG